MCEKRSRIIKKESLMARAREIRRLQRLNWHAPPNNTTSDNSNTAPVSLARKAAQNRVILELAWKTVALMHKNRVIQQKIIALQKETSEFIATVLNNPENRKRYMEQLRLHGLAQQTCQTKDDANTPMKVEPNV